MNIWGRFWHRFLGLTIAHGYRPQRALWYSLTLIIFGTFLFNSSYQKGLISPAADVGLFEEPTCLVLQNNSVPNSTCKQISLDYPVFNSVIYSIDVFLPIVDFYQESHWLPNRKQGSDLTFLKISLDNKVLRYYFWLHIVCGWVLTSLWVAGFTGLVRSQN